MRGRLGTPASGRHSPPKAGGGKDSPFRGGPLSAGISAFGGIRPREWRTPFVAVRATCLRSVKADGKEPPVTLGSLCRVPPARTRMIGSSAHPVRKKMGGTHAGLAPRHPPWFRAPARAGRRPAFQAVPAMAPSTLRALASIRAVGVRSRLLFTATGGRSVSPIHTPSRRSAPAVLRSAVPGWPVQVAAPRPDVRTVPGHRDFQRAPA